MQKDFVLSRTKSHSVVPPKFAGRGPRTLFPDNGGNRRPLLAVQGRSSRATFSRPLTGAHTCRSLSGLARPIYLPGHCCFTILKCDIRHHDTTAGSVCQRWILEKNKRFRIPNKGSGAFLELALSHRKSKESRKFIFPNFGAFFAGNAGHFELVVLL